MLVLISSGTACVRGGGKGGGSGGRTAPSPARSATPEGADRTAVPAPRAPAAPSAELALIYTASVQGQVSPPASPRNAPGGLARRATLVDKARLEAKAVVQVDAGDFLPAVDDPAFAAPGAFERRARLVLTAYQRMDVDAVTLGERELAIDVKALRKWIHDSKQPVVLANVTGSDGKPLFEGRRLFEAAEHKVGVFGVLEVGPDGAALAQRQNLTVGDPVLAARAAVQALRAAGAELVVGLLHVAGGEARARAIVAAVPGIDVVVQGHVESPASGGVAAVGSAAGGQAPPILVAVAAGGDQVGRIDVQPAAAGTSGWRFDDRRLSLDPTVRDQLAVTLLINADATPILGLTPPKTKKAAAATPEPVVYETWTYGSNGACQLCHPSQMEQWATTDHARAMASLKKKGHERDPACVGCHSVAFLQPGGTVNMNTLALNFGDVGCEACHGPSAAHVRSNKKKEGTSRLVDPLVCLGCHTPDQSQGPFDFAIALKDVLGPGHGLPTDQGAAK